MGVQRRENTPPNTHNETNSQSQGAENPCATSNFTKKIRSIVSDTLVSKLSTLFGPSGATRTPGLLNPNQARYHLRYTRIFSFCYYTTLGAKIKDFPVCGQSCGQSRFLARFGDQEKSCKRPCRKAFRTSVAAIVDVGWNTPKSSAIPPSLHPDIQFLLLYHAGGENQRFSCLWSILWSKPFFGPVC